MVYTLEKSLLEIYGSKTEYMLAIYGFLAVVGKIIREVLKHGRTYYNRYRSDCRTHNRVYVEMIKSKRWFF